VSFLEWNTPITFCVRLWIDRAKRKEHDPISAISALCHVSIGFSSLNSTIIGETTSYGRIVVWMRSFWRFDSNGTRKEGARERESLCSCFRRLYNEQPCLGRMRQHHFNYCDGTTRVTSPSPEKCITTERQTKHHLKKGILTLLRMGDLIVCFRRAEMKGNGDSTLPFWPS